MATALEKIKAIEEESAWFGHRSSAACFLSFICLGSCSAISDDVVSQMLCVAVARTQKNKATSGHLGLLKASDSAPTAQARPGRIDAQRVRDLSGTHEHAK